MSINSHPVVESYSILLGEVVRSTDCQFCARSGLSGRRWLARNGTYTQLEHKLGELNWVPCEDQGVVTADSILPPS